MQSCSAVFVGGITRYNSAHDYSQGVHLYELLGQATRVVLRKNGLTTSQALSQFLQQSNRGEHVLLKSYGSFSKSPLSKLCFLYSFFKIFDVDSISRNGLDYYQLSRLLCSDFPREYILKAVMLLLPNHDQAMLMYTLLGSKKFTLALYLYVIYTEHLEALQSYFQQEEELDFLETYKTLKQEDSKNQKEFSKPPFRLLVQGLLNIMKRKGLLSSLSSSVVFLTEENIQDFLRDLVTNNPGKGTNLPQLLQQLIDSPQFSNTVDENIGMFQNSPTWAAQIHKILSTRQPTQTPLNVKKKAAKK